MIDWIWSLFQSLAFDFDGEFMGLKQRVRNLFVPPLRIKRITTCIIALCISMSSIAFADESSNKITINNFNELSVKERATKAMSKGDDSFLGVHGYSSYAPGIDALKCSNHKIIYIAGTSDTPLDTTREMAAIDYAQQYITFLSFQNYPKK